MSTVLMSPEPATAELKLDHLRALEAESIHIMREVVAEFERPVMLYSIGKDSSVLLRLAQKAFYPGPIPFPLLHVDTTYKFREMIEFRDQMAAAVGARLIVHTNEEAIGDGTQPFKVGTQRCCGLLKTKALLDGLQAGNFDAAIGGARRDEEKSRAKERVFSIRNDKGQWDPKRQRPELWNLLNGRIRPGESIRVFPLSNWTEIDVWQYIQLENIARWPRSSSSRPSLACCPGSSATRSRSSRSPTARPGCWSTRCTPSRPPGRARGAPRCCCRGTTRRSPAGGGTPPSSARRTAGRTWSQRAARRASSTSTTARSSRALGWYRRSDGRARR